MSVLDKIRLFLDNVYNLKDTKIDFSDEEFYVTSKIFYFFKYLSSYEQEIVDANSKFLDNCFKNNEYYSGSYYLGTAEYDELLNKNIELKNSIENNQEDFIDKKDLIRKDDFSYVYAKYKIKNDVLERYIFEDPRYNQVYDDGIFIFKVFYKIEEIKNIAGVIFKDDFAIIPRVSLLKNKGDFRARNKFSQHCVVYNKIGDYYVSKSFVDDGRFLKYQNFINSLTKVNIIDSDAQIVKYDYNLYNNLAKCLRNKVSHNEFYTLYYYSHPVAIVCPITISNTKYGLIMPHYIFTELYLMNHRMQFKEQIKEYRTLYFPKRKGDLTENNVDSYLENVKDIKIIFKESYEKLKIIRYLEEILKNYDENKGDINTYIKNSLQEFNILFDSISVLPIKRYDIIKTIFFTDKNLKIFEKDDKYYMEKIIRKIFNNFYSYDFIDYKERNKFPFMKLYPSAVLNIVHILKSKIEYYVGLEEKESEGIELYSHEMSYTICLLYGYINLIFNNVLDCVNTEEDEYDILNQKLKTKILEINFDDFEVVSERRKPNHEEKIDIVKKIRNNIAHNTVLYKINKSGDYKKDILGFTNKKGNKILYEIESSKFIKFINQPIFLTQEFEDKSFVFDNFEKLNEIIKLKIFE